MYALLIMLLMNFYSRVTRLLLSSRAAAASDDTARASRFPLQLNANSQAQIFAFMLSLLNSHHTPNPSPNGSTPANSRASRCETAALPDSTSCTSSSNSD